MTATKRKTRILPLNILIMIVILAAVTPTFLHTPAHAQTPFDTPGAPTVTTIDHDSLSISWTRVAGIPGYPPVLYNLSFRAGTSGDWIVTGADFDTPPHVQNGLQPNTLYQWRVQSVGFGTSEWSGVGQAWTEGGFTPPPPPIRPPTPFTPSVTPLNHDSLQISWSSVPGATGYDLRWRRDGTSSWTDAYSVSAGHRIPDLQPETRYEAQVRAKNIAGASEWSGGTKGTTLPQPDLKVSVTTGAQDIAAGASIALAATASDPLEEKLSYNWTASPAEGSFHNATLLTPTWTAPAPSADQPVTLTLTVSGTYNRIKSDTVVLTVVPLPGIPTAVSVSVTTLPQDIAGGTNINLSETVGIRVKFVGNVDGPLRLL